MDLLEVLDEAELPVGLGAGDEAPVGVGLAAVDVEELGGGLEVGAGQAGVGVRAVLLGRPPAVAVGEAVADAGEVVLDPLGIGGERVGVVVEVLAGGVDPLRAVTLEGVADGVVSSPSPGCARRSSGGPGSASRRAVGQRAVGVGLGAVGVLGDAGAPTTG